MDRPGTLIGIAPSAGMSRTRLVSLVAVGVLHAAFIYALVSGLAVRMAVQLPHELMAQVVDQPQPKTEPPPLPQPANLAQPSLPTVELPLIKIVQPRAVVHPITTYVGPPVLVHVAPAVTAPPVAPPAPTPPSGIARTHTIPPYPELARRMGQQGEVRLRIAVGMDGHVSDAAVVVSSGVSSLDDAALAWVKDHWLYKPATQGGQPVESTVQAVVVFDLKKAA